MRINITFLTRQTLQNCIENHFIFSEVLKCLQPSFYFGNIFIPGKSHIVILRTNKLKGVPGKITYEKPFKKALA